MRSRSGADAYLEKGSLHNDLIESIVAVGDRPLHGRRLVPEEAPTTWRVANGTRTRDHRDHNPGLYQLSYRHQATASYPDQSPASGVSSSASRSSTSDS